MTDCLKWVGLWACLRGCVLITLIDVVKLCSKVSGTIPEFGPGLSKKENSVLTTNTNVFIHSVSAFDCGCDQLLQVPDFPPVTEYNLEW